MVTMYRRENGIFYLKFKGVDGREIRLSTGESVKREALKVKRKVEEDMVADRLQAPTSEALSFQGAWDYYAVTLAPQKKEKTLYNDASVWKQFSLWCRGKGIVSLDSLKVGDVALWQAEMLSLGRSPVGVNTYLRTCNLIVSHLIRLQRIKIENPFKQVKQIRESKKVKYIDWPDIIRLVDTAREVGRDIHLVFILGALAGMRKAEILAARWEHVEWAKGQLLVEGTKTAASRNYIPLHQALHDALLPYLPEEIASSLAMTDTGGKKKDAGWSPYIVAPGKAPTRAVTTYRWDWRKQWRKVETLEAKAAKEDGREAVHATPHQLRHSVATHLLDAGYTIQQVAVFLRHANDVPTRRYADLKGVELEIDKF